MSKWMRILVSVGLLIVVCGAYLWLFGMQTLYIWESRKMARISPIVWTTPVELSDLSVSQSAGKRLSYFGYDFEVPWGDIDEARTRVVGTNKVTIMFRSGNYVLFWVSRPNQLLSNVEEDKTTDRKRLKEAFGAQSVQSDYDFMRTALEITPASFSLLMPKKRAAWLGPMFMLKGLALRPGSETGVFFIATKEFKGFQFGRPESRRRYLSIELMNDDGHVDITFGRASEATTPISQAEVNRLVQSVHKVSNLGGGPEQ
jgi:hypothetical protein